MSAKKMRKSHGRTGGGRPRLEGDRYPSGGLKPPGPNLRVVAQARALVGPDGDITKATCDLDVALERQWITQDHHKAARAYTSLYHRAGVDLPRMRTANLGEGEGEYARQASRAGVVMQGAVIRPVRDLDGDSVAHDTLRMIWGVLTSQERQVLAHACLTQGQLQFVRMRARGLTYTDRNELLLKQALTVVSTLLDPRHRALHHLRNDRVEVA